MMKKVMSSPLFWTGVISAAMAIGGFAWYYQRYRAFHARFDSLMNAGWNIETHLPLFPRVLVLVGLLGVMLTLACVIRAIERRRR